MDSKKLSKQLKKPSGTDGIEVANALNESNRSLYELTFSLAKLDAGHRLLEIGFGNGRHFPDYFDLEPELTLTGIDFSADMCEEARRLNTQLIDSGRLSVHCTDTTALPFDTASFDCAVAVNVIYFMDPPDLHLSEIHRVLKPGGLFIVGYRPKHTVEHLPFTRQNFRLYEPEELTSLLHQYGFQKVQEKHRNQCKQAIDGTDVEVIDACLVVRKSIEH